MCWEVGELGEVGRGGEGGGSQRTRKGPEGYIGVVSVVSQYNCVYYCDTCYIPDCAEVHAGSLNSGAGYVQA
jgi:hypothetical protein